MAQTSTCDIPDCGKPAIDTIEVKSATTTPIKLDVCIDHLAEYKKIMRVFTGQELESA